MTHDPHTWGTPGAATRTHALQRLAEFLPNAGSAYRSTRNYDHGPLETSAELTDTGYLHNHARMWFPSIWIFTLRLPWQLGADFFLRHLLDGDPASNTLSWRWVAGLHTQGKLYLARPENIARYAGRRFGDAPPGLEHLVAQAEPLTDAARHDKVDPAWPTWSAPAGPRVGWLLTEDDLMLDLPGKPAAVASLAPRRPGAARCSNLSRR